MQTYYLKLISKEKDIQADYSHDGFEFRAGFTLIPSEADVEMKS
jgi:hypothetical protein